MERQTHHSRPKFRRQRSRLRENFLERIGTQLEDVIAFTSDEGGDDEAILDSARDLLQRIGQTSGSLGLDRLAEAATKAAELAERGERFTDALPEVLAAVRKLQEKRQVVRPLLVWVEEAQVKTMRRRAGLHALPLQLVTTQEEVRAALEMGTPAALAMSVEDLDALPSLGAARSGVPLVVVGPGESLEARQAAARCGAHAFLEEPLILSELVTSASTLQSMESPPRVLVMGHDAFAVDWWVQSLRDGGCEVEASTDASSFLGTLDAQYPDVLLIENNVEGVPALERLRIIRAHRRWWDLPVLVIGEEELDAEALAAGADGRMSPDALPEALQMRVKALARRRLSLAQARLREPRTGVLSRGAFLQFLERLMAATRRRRSALALAVIGVDNEERRDEILVHAVARLRAEVRVEDLVARLEDDALAVCLVGASAEQSAVRLREVQRDLMEALDLDEITSFTAGVVDTVDDPYGLLLRAGQALMAARAIGRGTVLVS